MDIVKKSASEYFQGLAELLSTVQVTDGRSNALALDDGTDKAVDLILSVKAGPGKIMVIGNGGSASIAGHIHNDLCKSVGARAIVFNEPSLLTALANDHGYECVFERPVKLWARTGDLLVAISSSGRSESILKAVRAAIDRGCQVITLSGFDADNPLRGLGHLNFYVASHFYGYVELAHAALTHCFTDRAAVAQPIEEKLS